MIFIPIVLLVFAIIWWYINRPPFGRAPAGDRLKKISSATNYLNGKFQNQHFTPDLKEGTSMVTVLNDFVFKRSKNSKPPGIIPTVKTDLHTLPIDKNLMVWFGHSSYFLQIDGKKILVDPVFSGSASPVNFTTRSFIGTDVYTAADMPMIDYLFITHDHWDHLDYPTIKALQPKIKKIITGLGVGAHLERWGFDSRLIEEKNWHETVELNDGFKVTAAPARHFSGRGLKRNQAIWLSFVLQTPAMKVYIGGDSGYDSHFKEEGDQYGPFDFAILECGQYNEYWKYIHMMPEEVVQACIDLRAAKFFPVHWSKFSLALHAWNEPIERVTAEANKRNIKIVTGIIGEAIDLNNEPTPNYWWQTVT